MPFHSLVLNLIEYLLVLVYFTIALKNTYKQSTGVTIAKAVGIAAVYFFVMSIGLAVTGLTALR